MAARFECNASEGFKAPSPTSKSGFVMLQHRQEDYNKLRFPAKMTDAGSGTGNTLESGYPEQKLSARTGPCTPPGKSPPHRIVLEDFQDPCATKTLERLV
jgi:hypothetical protein